MNAAQRVRAPARVPLFLAAKSDEDLCLFAKHKAGAVWHRCQKATDLQAVYHELAVDAAKLGVVAPVLGEGGKTLDSVLARLADEYWWRRALRRMVGRQLEQDQRLVGRVHRRAGIYVSDQGLKRRRLQKRRNTELLALMEAVNELGESFSLSDLQALSVSNPRIRRSELMARISGFELCAQTLGHVAEFYTISAPSRMHCRRSKSGGAIPDSYDMTPDEVQRYLCDQWAKIRADWQRRDVRVYGFRVVEPHHDGTPHWHLLLFMPERARETVRETLRRYALEIDGDELGAAKHRFRMEAIDPNKGSAVGYIAKYIAKNIDGYQLETDSYGTPAEKAAERIEAWASTWGIRQFQQIGGPPVSIWRELRRVTDAPEGLLEQARLAADSGQWGLFVALTNGPQSSRRDSPLKLAKIWSDELGRYGEPVGYTVFGITAGVETLTTRIHAWAIQKAGVSSARGELTSPRPALTRSAGVAGSYARLAAKPPLEFCQ